MAAISVLPPIHLETRMVDSDSEVTGVVVCPEHVVNVEDHRLPGHVQYGGFLYLLSYGTGDIIILFRETKQSGSPCSAGEQNGSLHDPFIIFYQVSPALLAILYSRLHGDLSENHFLNSLSMINVGSLPLHVL